MIQLLKLLVPYFSVAVFWCALSNAWLALIAYHVVILLLCRIDLSSFTRPFPVRFFLLAFPSMLAGPFVYFLLSYMTKTDITVWLNIHHLSSLSLFLMIPYFGICHPFLEQMYWSPLRDKTILSHFFFAGYHVIVLQSLLTLPWLVMCFIVLLAASFAWKHITQKANSLMPAVLSHIFADFGIIFAVWLATG